MAVVFDDLELANLHQPEIVVDTFMLAVSNHVDRFTDDDARREQLRTQARGRISLHLAVLMIEAWFFADPAGPTTSGVSTNVDIHCARTLTDSERFRTSGPATKTPSHLALYDRFRDHLAQPRTTNVPVGAASLDEPMSISEIPFAQASEADILRMVENSVRETARLDYKLGLPGNADKDKREFLRDVSAFANAEGGDLLFGIREVDGVATEVVGLDPGGIDDAIQKFTSRARDSINPRVLRLRMRGVELTSGRWVLHIRVNRSLDAPHMVTFKGMNQFWTRNPAGKHPMSTAEVKAAVMRGADWRAQTDRWRESRADLLEAGDGPSVVSGPARMLVHLVPFGWDGQLPRGLVKKGSKLANHGIQWTSAGWIRPTFDGLLCTNALHRKPVRRYTLWLNDGRVEFARSDLLFKDQHERLAFNGAEVETAIAKAVRLGLDGLKLADVPPPIGIGIVLMGVEGSCLAGNHYGYILNDEEFYVDRSRLVFPMEVVTDPVGDVWPVVRPICDRLWQAAGYEGSPFFNEDGSRKGG